MLKTVFNFEFKKIIKEKGIYLVFFLLLPVIINYFIFNKVLMSDKIYESGISLLNFSIINFSLPWALMFSFLLSNDSFVKDKNMKIYDTILSTPITIPVLITIKALAISTISVLIVLIEQLLIIIGLNLYIYISYNISNIIIPEIISILILLLVTPVLVFSITLIIGFIFLASKKQKILALISSILIFGFMFFSTSKKELFLCSWELFYIMLSITISMFLISILLIRRLKKEDIILSV